MNDTETWLPIPDWEGLYEVSDLGRVRSFLRWRRDPGHGRILAGWDVKGYRTVSLSRDKKRSSRGVHVLVARAFIGPRPDGMDVCHGDGDSSNNRLDNLRYGTRSDNVLDEIAHGTHRHASRTHCDKGHELTEDNIYRNKARPKTRACRKCRAEWRSWPKPDHNAVAHLVGAREAGDILGINAKSVYTYMTHSPDFPQPERIRNRLFFDPDALRAWRKRHPATQAKAA